jgi:hypothetical protein
MCACTGKKNYNEFMSLHTYWSAIKCMSGILLSLAFSFFPIRCDADMHLRLLTCTASQPHSHLLLPAQQHRPAWWQGASMNEALPQCAWCGNSCPTHMVLDPCGLLGSNIGYVPSFHLTSPAVVAEVKLRQTPLNDWNYSVSISSSKTSWNFFYY